MQIVLLYTLLQAPWICRMAKGMTRRLVGLKLSKPDETMPNAGELYRDEEKQEG